MCFKDSPKIMGQNPAYKPIKRVELGNKHVSFGEGLCLFDHRWRMESQVPCSSARRSGAPAAVVAEACHRGTAGTGVVMWPL